LEIPKKLDIKKIVGLIGVIFGIFLLLLIVSGVFSESENISIPQNSDQQFQSPGADLNSISKINELRSLVEREPNNASAVLDLANLRFDSGFFEDAAKNYDQYLKLNPKSADARIDMAVCYYNLQQFDRAEFEILEALKIAPKHQTGYLNLGVVYLAKQNIEKSREWFNKAVELDPTSEIGKKAKSLLQSH
jgi:tetratricopeptide (TPR) repeat protein